MNEIVSISPMPLPEPRVPITIRPGTMGDIAFLDSLQKKTTKQVGWMPTKQFEGKIRAGHVLIAENNSPQRHGGTENTGDSSSVSPCLRGEPVGYLIGNDQYFKRDDVGIIYQINVVPEMRRSLVAASLLKAQFERSAYGCRLYCCWCAQDIEANRFWESMGFVPLAFRAGSEKKSRVHIFWQKRIRSGDDTTPWWFPSKTDGGAIREDRIVLPIPPGTHWSDAKPLILPNADCRLANEEEPKRLPRGSNRKSAIGHRQSAPPPITPRADITAGGLRFEAATPMPTPAEEPIVKPATKATRVKRKCDPRVIAAARELRDRWLEQVNNDAPLLPAGKYEVSRAVERAITTPLLEAA